MRRSLAMLLAVAACGARSTPPKAEHEEDEEGETERGSIPGNVQGPPKVAWKDLDHAHRAKFMAAVVVPTMKPLFIAFDAKTFDDFGCATCHGPGAKAHTFKMPNAELFALPTSLDTLPADKAPWVKFMTSEVAPEMAKLLGLPERDPAHPDPVAFGCANCHTTK